jgi:histidyl-tRNA synthetase
VLARINNRKILSGLLEALGIADRSGEVFDVIDHAEKVTPEQTKDSFMRLGFDGGIIAKLVAFSNLHGEREFVVKNLAGLGINNETFNAGVAELDRVMSILELDGRKGEIEADMKIVRGLDYYTGTVFEFILPEYRQIGSVCGGGRYENLTGYFSEQKFPGVGGSIGLTRLFYVLNENNLAKSQEEKPINYALVPLSDNEMEYALKLARDFRSRGESVMVVPGDKKLGDKMKYAAKVAKYGIVLGENEVMSGTYDVKEFF